MDKTQQQRNVKLIQGQNKQFIIFEDQIIGNGASAVVKKAINKQQQRILAVKIINITSKQENKEVALKELQIAHQLPYSQYLVRIQKTKVQSSKNIYIFLEYCNGGSLATLLKQQVHLDEIGVYKLFCHLMEGYKILFDAHVLHEDLKPQNILINDSCYKISDFGLSIFSRNYKYGNVRKGTLYYMSFQKLTRKQYFANSKSDVYSLGVLLYEAITGRHPYVLKRGLELKQFITQFRQGKLKQDFLGYNLKFLSLFEIVIRMVAKSEQKRISFDEVYEWYNKCDFLKAYKINQPLKSRLKQKLNNNYNILEVSRANIQNLQLQTQQINCINYQNNKSLLESKTTEYLDEISKFKNIISFRRALSYLFFQLAKLISEYVIIQNQSQCSQFYKLQLAAYLARFRLLKQLQIPLKYDSLYQQYQSDCQIAETDLISHISHSPLRQNTKKQLSNIFKGIQQKEIIKIIYDMLVNMQNKVFKMIRINYKQQVSLYGLINRTKNLLEKQNFDIDEINNTWLKIEDGLEDQQRQISQNLSKYSMIMDSEEPLQNVSDQFEVLEWDKYIQNK